MTPHETRWAPDDESPQHALGRSLAGGVVGGLLIAAVEFAALWDSVSSSLPDQLGWLARLAVHWSLAALPVGAAIGALERSSRGRQPSAKGYAVAVVSGAVAGAVVLSLHATLVDSISTTALGFDVGWSDAFLYGFWQLLFWGAVGAMLHASNLRQRRGAAALRAGEHARLRSERDLAAVQLDALLAQVEPEFVLSTLSAIERLYEQDSVAADRVLDALIQFLRESTPLLRRQASTIGQECRLVRAYVRTLGAATGVGDVVRVEVDERAETRPLPPGSLLTLAQLLLGVCPSNTGAASFDMRATSLATRTNIELSVTATGVDHSDLATSIGRVEQRLKSSCGPLTTLQVRRDGPQTHALKITLVNDEGGT